MDDEVGMLHRVHHDAHVDLHRNHIFRDFARQVVAQADIQLRMVLQQLRQETS
jgi:hypothetical protein